VLAPVLDVEDPAREKNHGRREKNAALPKKSEYAHHEPPNVPAFANCKEIC
jgi:hypothetical protein